MSGTAGSQPSSRLTVEQEDALAVAGSSVALSAGAGSGKTTVLTARFVRALEGANPTPLGRVVALTFTNKAARELRDRIRRECRTRLEAGGDPTYWRGVVRGLEAARIGTFHSFCGEILRGHAIEAGIDPGFVVLDDQVTGALRDEALAVALRDRLAHRDRDLIELAVDFGLSAVLQALNSLLGNRSGGDIAAWTTWEPHELVNLWLDRWSTLVRPALLGQVRAACQPILDLIANHPLDAPKVQAKMGDFAASVASLNDPGDAVLLVEAVRGVATVAGLTAKGLWPNSAVYEAVRDGFKTIRDVADKVKPKLAWDEHASTEAAVHGIRFARVATHARATYDQMKRDRSGVDHDDLLLLTRDLVDRSELVRQALGESVDLVLVDEFQDTDPVQGTILRQMLGGPERASDGRLFLVGDFKQSIYRFRGADPELFRQFRAGVPIQGQRNLTANFRSVPEVLDFVNALFADTFTEAGSALQPGRGDWDRTGPPAVLFSWGTPQVNPPGEKDKARADVQARRADEAHRLARYLADRLAGGWTIRDPAQPGRTRLAHAGDVAILFRSLADSSTYEQALVAEGLDFHVVGGSGFFAQLEVLDLINVLSAVEDPSDGVALAGALRSPFFALSDDALFWVASECPGALHAGLERMTEAAADRLPLADRPRVERARRLLARWRAVKDSVPIATLVDQILGDSGYEAALLGEFLGDRKRANARKLVRMARRLDDAGGFILADFVERLRNDLRAATKETQAATTDDGGRIVRLMSIHQSKGLEFPIVVVPDLDRERPGERRRVAFHADLGPLVNPVTDADDGDESKAEPGGSLGWSVYTHLEKVADDAESLRLFYVATTRARDALILSAATDPTRTPKSPALLLLDRRFDRTTGQFRGELPDGWPSPRVALIDHDAPLPPGAPARVRDGGRRKLPLLEVADAIRSTRVDLVVAPTRREGRTLPGWVTLDPSAGLASTAARLDRLARAILQDPRGFDPEATVEVAGRAARLQDPVAGSPLIDQAVTRVRGWLERLPSDLAGDQAERSGAWTWSIPWKLAGSTTIFHGSGDFRFRHRDGSTDLLLVGDLKTNHAAEKLRALLSARSLANLGNTPVDRVWWLGWNKLDDPLRFDRWDDTALQLAIEHWSEDSPLLRGVGRLE